MTLVECNYAKSILTRELLAYAHGMEVAVILRTPELPIIAVQPDDPFDQTLSFFVGGAGARD